MLALMDQGQIFDVAKTREWIASRRIEGVMPCIRDYETLLVIACDLRDVPGTEISASEELLPIVPNP